MEEERERERGFNDGDGKGYKVMVVVVIMQGENGIDGKKKPHQNLSMKASLWEKEGVSGRG